MPNHIYSPAPTNSLLGENQWSRHTRTCVFVLKFDQIKSCFFSFMWFVEFSNC
uniref:Uncharacterized protein n=1 Tax=Anguilla anguilla TaxID=7936 RepID=A0A0E9VTZ4_ANGAN